MPPVGEGARAGNRGGVAVDQEGDNNGDGTETVEKSAWDCEASSSRSGAWSRHGTERVHVRLPQRQRILMQVSAPDDRHGFTGRRFRNGVTCPRRLAKEGRPTAPTEGSDREARGSQKRAEPKRVGRWWAPTRRDPTRAATWRLLCQDCPVCQRDPSLRSDARPA